MRPIHTILCSIAALSLSLSPAPAQAYPPFAFTAVLAFLNAVGAGISVTGNDETIDEDHFSSISMRDLESVVPFSDDYAEADDEDRVFQTTYQQAVTFYELTRDAYLGEDAKARELIHSIVNRINARGGSRNYHRDLPTTAHDIFPEVAGDKYQTAELATQWTYAFLKTCGGSNGCILPQALK